MASFEAFDAVLATPMPADHWSDVEVVRASALVDGFDVADWELVRKTWPLRPSAWQVRLADAIFGTSAPEATALLLALLRAEADEVAIAAVDSLFARDGWSASADDRRALERLRARLGPARSGVIDRILI